MSFNVLILSKWYIFHAFYSIIVFLRRPRSCPVVIHIYKPSEISPVHITYVKHDGFCFGFIRTTLINCTPRESETASSESVDEHSDLSSFNLLDDVQGERIIGSRLPLNRKGALTGRRTDHKDAVSWPSASRPGFALSAF